MPVPITQDIVRWAKRLEKSSQSRKPFRSKSTRLKAKSSYKRILKTTIISQAGEIRLEIRLKLHLLYPRGVPQTSTEIMQSIRLILISETSSEKIRDCPNLTLLKTKTWWVFFGSLNALSQTKRLLKTWKLSCMCVKNCRIISPAKLSTAVPFKNL